MGVYLHIQRYALTWILVIFCVPVSYIAIYRYTYLRLIPTFCTLWFIVAMCMCVDIYLYTHIHRYTCICLIPIFCTSWFIMARCMCVDIFIYPHVYTCLDAGHY